MSKAPSSVLSTKKKVFKTNNGIENKTLGRFFFHPRPCKFSTRAGRCKRAYRLTFTRFPGPASQALQVISLSTHSDLSLERRGTKFDAWAILKMFLIYLHPSPPPPPTDTLPMSSVLESEGTSCTCITRRDGERGGRPSVIILTSSGFFFVIFSETHSIVCRSAGVSKMKDVVSQAAVCAGPDPFYILPNRKKKRPRYLSARWLS